MMLNRVGKIIVSALASAEAAAAALAATAACELAVILFIVVDREAIYITTQ